METVAASLGGSLAALTEPALLDWGEGALRRRVEEVLARLTGARRVWFVAPGDSPPADAYALTLEVHGQALGWLVLEGVSALAPSIREEVRAVALVGLALLRAVQALHREERLQREARARQRRLQAIIDAIPEALVIVRAPTAHITMANRWARHMLGTTEDGRLSIGSLYDLRLFTPEGVPLPFDQRPVTRCWRGEVCEGLEVLLEVRPGQRIPLLVNAAPLTNEQGQVTGAVVVWQDISRLKRMERLRSDFLSMVSHDLRTPLASIKTAISALRTAPALEPAATAELFQAIDEETERLVRMVNDLLDLSRLEAGALPMEPEECGLGDIVQQAVREVERSGLTQGRTLQVDIPPTLPSLWADVSHIQRVVVNLLVNALAHTPASSPVRLSAYHDDRRNEVVVCVADQGPGIPPEDLPHLFERFYRSPHKSGRGYGIGLGLAICKALVELHGGRIWAESALGQGSTFYFALPLAKTDAQR
ncbi:MAG: ATP-binding protein [Dehalococcoidia bacterium]|nr:ATP-binding protein [Dehalococcoidia bacterium]MDW8119356.1 ATP-binding protein [Chloroflexota bacterium]